MDEVYQLCIIVYFMESIPITVMEIFPIHVMEIISITIMERNGFGFERFNTTKVMNLNGLIPLMGIGALVLNGLIQL